MDKRAEVRQWLIDYKSKLSCARCGFRHPAALQFHHWDSRKEFNVSSAVALGKSIKQIEKEILKCEVICANCHLIHHYDQHQEVRADRMDEDATYQEMKEEY